MDPIFLEEQYPEQMIIPKDQRLQEYDHLTFYINSLTEFINVIQLLQEKSEYSDAEYVYRGMTDYSWELIPSIARGMQGTDSLENQMVSEMITLRPEEFNTLSNFDLLAKLQHFGIPTRLLDFSSNPLVALFFACKDSNNAIPTIARVICANDTSYYTNIDIIEAICGSYKYDDYKGIYIDDLLSERINLVRYQHACLFTLMAKPKYISERIKRQSAVFMVFPNELSDYRARAAYYELLKMNSDFNYLFPVTEPERQRLDWIKNNENLAKVYRTWTSKIPIHPYEVNCIDTTVTPSRFSKLMNQYKSLEKSTKPLKSSYDVLKKYDNIFKKRFSLESSILKIDEDVMKKAFCSILIEPQYKGKILKELNMIGINESFLFPELEYTAKAVKNKYMSY